MLPGKSITQRVFDSFTFLRSNGTHPCLIMNAAKASVHGVKNTAYHRLLHLHTARAIASQLILAMHFIRSQGIVHGGMYDMLKSLPSTRLR